MASLSTPNAKRLTATAAILFVVLVGAVGVALAQTSSRKATAETRIDFRRIETLAWSLELDHDSPDALHNVTCFHIAADRFECSGKDAAETTQVRHILVGNDGRWWQTYDEESGH
jgi:hypothetical protein